MLARRKADHHATNISHNPRFVDKDPALAVTKWAGRL